MIFEQLEDAVSELKAQGFTVEFRTPQDGTWCVNLGAKHYIMKGSQMLELMRNGKLNLAGIQELDERLRRT